jgi:hypothetical protein
LPTHCLWIWSSLAILVVSLREFLDISCECLFRAGQTAKE